MFGIGVRNFVNIRNRETGERILMPGVIVSNPVTVMTDLADGRKRPSTFAWVITLRTTNPANGPVREYFDLSYENMKFSPLRDEPVVGLDFDEKGLPISIEQLKGLHARGLAAFQAQLSAAQAPVELALDGPSA